MNQTQAGLAVPESQRIERCATAEGGAWRAGVAQNEHVRH